MKFIKLTLMDRKLAHSFIFVNPYFITTIEAVTYDATWSVITHLNKETTCVLETPEEIFLLMSPPQYDPSLSGIMYKINKDGNQ